MVSRTQKMGRRYTPRRAGFALAVLEVLVPCLASAATWLVRQDGTGDFTTIQPALDAAARGDTVRIGPGRYLEFAPFAIEDILIKDTFAGVTADSLTLIGAGAGSTIIGPETPSYWGQEPTGIAMRDTLTYLEIRNLSVSGVHDGIELRGGARVSACEIQRTDTGLASNLGSTVTVDSCTFREQSGDGVVFYAGTGPVAVRHCIFDANALAIEVLDNQNVHIENCTITGGTVGIQYEGVSSGVITSVRIESFLNIGVIALNQSFIDLTNVQLIGGRASLNSEFGAVITGRRNVLRGASFETITLYACATVDLHESHILGDGMLLVHAHQCNRASPAIVDLTGNYWGISNPDSIASRIRDSSDDPALNVIVQFEPFANDPLAPRNSTLGNVKWRFRGHGEQ